MESFNFSPFSTSDWGINLEYCDVEWFVLETTKVILSFLRLHASTIFQTLLLAMRASAFLLRDSCQQQ